MASRAGTGGKRTKTPRSSSSSSSSGTAGRSASHYISYTADGGGQVYITFPFNPYAALGLTSTASYDAVKMAFKDKIAVPTRQNRALASLANHILTSTAPRYQRQPGSNEFTIKKRDHFTVAACGYTEKLKRMIERNTSLIVEADEHGRTLLYLACKSGFYDMVKMLLLKGADINKKQKDGSTPLHGAAFFGHNIVVGLLLEYGAKTDIKNRWESTALQEGATTEIKNTIQNAPSDLILSLANKLKEKRLVSNIRLIEFKGKVIAKELIRDPQTLDAHTRSSLPEILKKWELTWHGTRFKNLESILKRGLLPAGTGGIKPPPNHFSLGQNFFGIPNWAAAIFVSPSILYSAHAAYSERVISKREQWCVLVKAYCYPESYKAYDPTVLRYLN